MRLFKVHLVHCHMSGGQQLLSEEKSLAGDPGKGRLACG